MKDPRFLARHSIRVNQGLASHTAIGVGGNADFFGSVEIEKSFVKLLNDAQYNGLKTLVLGQGTNTVFSDHGFRGLVIDNQVAGIEYLKGAVTAGGSVPLSQLVEALAAESCGGLEAFGSLTGSVGSALRRNAAAGGSRLGDHLIKARLYSKGSVIEVAATDLELTPSGSRLERSGEIVLGAQFRVAKKPAAEITKALLTATQARLRDRPGATAAIRVFRDPPDRSVAELANLVGLAGERVGGAVISQKDPNYIINEGGATAAEVYELAQRIKHRVSLKLGQKLVAEVTWAGEW